MTELESKIKQSEIESNRKYPLLDITNNRKEIRAISINAQDYMVELNPDVKRLKIWEAIPRIVIEFILASFKQLKKGDAKESGKSSVIIGDLMELGIEYMSTSDAIKAGNITPFIHCRSEFKFENASIPYIDAVPIDIAKQMREERCEGLPIQFFDNRKVIKEISILAMHVLTNNYGIIMGEEEDWWMIPLVVVAFFRKSKEFLIEHKDDGGIGVKINFADLIKFGITKEGGIEEGDPVDYVLYINPNQIFKKDNAKSDGDTED